MTARWICLLYHDVLAARPEANGGAERFAVSARCFERQLATLAEQGYVGSSIEEVLTAGAGARVAISFDDGTRGQYEHAFPALLARGMTATFFVVTAWVGRPGYVTWEELREMRSAGMSIGSHTRTHPFLSELGRRRVADELRRSKEELDVALEQDTRTLALPGGDWPGREHRHLLGEAGYRAVATSRWGWNREGQDTLSGGVLRVRRCTVRGEPSRVRFLRILRADPWLGARQRCRQLALNGVRRAMGASTYARVRRRVLDAGTGVAHPTGGPGTRSEGSDG